MKPRLVSDISDVEVIAIGKSIREHNRLRKMYGPGQISDGTAHLAELHWYEAHGIGKKEIKIKRILV